MTSNICIFLKHAPYIFYWADEVMLERVFAKSENNGEKDLLELVKAQIRHDCASEYSIHYFTENGLWEFVETGRCSDYPTDWQQPFQVSERCLILERMFESMENTVCEIHLIKGRYLNITPRLSLVFCDTEGLVFRIRDEQDHFRYVKLLEDSISHTFRDYLMDMRGQEAVYTQEEAKEILRKCFETVRKMQ